MSKRTNKVVHSDTSKEENEISLDTVLEHSVNSRDENMMAMEDKTSNPNRKQRKARKKAKHLSQKWQSMPSRTIDDMVGKLSNKDDETLTKRSFDRTDEEDFSLSYVEDVKKQSMPSRTIKPRPHLLPADETVA
ncbi:uncharacterized protein LOC132760009 [Ruditapes philippinarum]|uniref:uncharacterized protein LOC132760009 n=1 Tax=Ruditapes philippinarum TaxID=129788 RepID=UPI00295B462F|nr:uncharacterized protein LOC132760009 [Ruditapes philippinarum]